MVTNNNVELNLSNKIILRSARGKVGNKVIIQPCKDKFGRFPDCVKQVDSNNNMILSEKELNDPNRIYFIRETDTFEVVDGTTYDLDNVLDRFIWEAIKNCPLIAPDIYAKDARGNNLINGTIGWNNPTPRYGVAELYIERPGVESNRRVSRKKLKHDAEAFIWTDERGAEGRVLKARLLGHKMNNMPDADVTEYLLQVADLDPEKIIALYTGGDTAVRLLFMEARDKHVINRKDGVFIYNDNVVLGATDEAAILYLKDPKNANVYNLIKRDTYPELVQNIEEKIIDLDKKTNKKQ